jgi:hypothetical protein
VERMDFSMQHGPFWRPLFAYSSGQFAKPELPDLVRFLAGIEKKISVFQKRGGQKPIVCNLALDGSPEDNCLKACCNVINIGIKLALSGVLPGCWDANRCNAALLRRDKELLAVVAEHRDPSAILRDDSA